MAVPSRAFVGMVVFGLIASLAIIPYTALVMSGYAPPPDSPQEVYLRQPSAYEAGDKIVLVLGCIFSVGITVFAWRGLLAGARRDARRREELKAGKGASGKTAADESRDERPPGYS